MERHKQKSLSESFDHLLFFLSNFCERRASPLWAGRRRPFKVQHQKRSKKLFALPEKTVAGSLSLKLPSKFALSAIFAPY
jgi:hypothetical protein